MPIAFVTADTLCLQRLLSLPFIAPILFSLVLLSSSSHPSHLSQFSNLQPPTTQFSGHLRTSQDISGHSLCSNARCRLLSFINCSGSLKWKVQDYVCTELTSASVSFPSFFSVSCVIIRINYGVGSAHTCNRLPAKSFEYTAASS